MIDQWRLNIEKLLAENAAIEALQMIEQICESILGAQATSNENKPIRQIKNEAIVKSAACNRLLKDRRKGILSSEDYDISVNRMNHDTMDLVTELADQISKKQTPVASTVSQVDLNPSAFDVKEKIFGQNTLQNLSWLEKGLVASKSVCRIVCGNHMGTGFLVSDDYIITNNHVIPSSDLLLNARVEFNFQELIDGRIADISTYEAKSDSLDFHTNEELDFTIFRISDNANSPDIGSWGSLDLAIKNSIVEVGDHVTIIQHPNGGQKKISLTENQIVNIKGDKLQYMTDTLPGSSGSPVFNAKWEVVAIHHAGGNLLKNEKGDRIFANQGILFSSIAASDYWQAQFPAV